ncbi:MAG: META domain-containing protein [Burkholderiales bacterium]|jgi:heat shock protein HslJ
MKALRFTALLIACAVAAPSAQAQGISSRAMRKKEDEEKQKIEDQKRLVSKREKRFPMGSAWIAVSLNGKPFTGAERPSFTISDQYRATGFGGCNAFSATAYPLREQHIAVGPIALTKKQCDKGVMALEQAFLVALRTAAQWDIVEGGSLVVKSQAGELRFERTL